MTSGKNILKDILENDGFLTFSILARVGFLAMVELLEDGYPVECLAVHGILAFKKLRHTPRHNSDMSRHEVYSI